MSIIFSFKNLLGGKYDGLYVYHIKNKYSNVVSYGKTGNGWYVQTQTALFFKPEIKLFDDKFVVCESEPVLTPISLEQLRKIENDVSLVIKIGSKGYKVNSIEMEDEDGRVIVRTDGSLLKADVYGIPYGKVKEYIFQDVTQKGDRDEQ